MVHSVGKPSQRKRVNRPRRQRQIPKEFDALLKRFTKDPHERVEYWWYGLVLLMLERNQVVMTGQHQAAGRAWVTLRAEGESEFEIVRPPLTDEMEARLRQGVREIVAARQK